jgi:hypothetical protein
VSVLVFFEDLALLTSHKIVNRDFVLDRFLFTLDEEYRRWGPTIDFFRSERGVAAFAGFESLATEARGESASGTRTTRVASLARSIATP